MLEINDYTLDQQDMKAFLKWEMLSPLWERGERPTDAEWERHFILGRISMILYRSRNHNPFQAGNPSAELWNLYVDSGNELALKYYQRFNPSFALAVQQQFQEPLIHFTSFYESS